MKKKFDILPTWAIAITAIAIVGGGIFAITQINKGRERRRLRREGKELTHDIESDISIIAKPTTLSKTNYNLLATRLYNALNSWNTDEVQVYQVFAQMNNERDVYELIKAFGMRIDTSDPFALDIDKSLGAFMQKLNDEEINAINFGLARKAIKYRF